MLYMIMNNMKTKGRPILSNVRPQNYLLEYIYVHENVLCTHAPLENVASRKISQTYIHLYLLFLPEYESRIPLIDVTKARPGVWGPVGWTTSLEDVKGGEQMVLGHILGTRDRLRHYTFTQ